MLRQARLIGVFVAAALGVMLGTGRAAEHHDPRAIAVLVKQKAEQICHEARTVFAYVAPGQLIAQKAAEVSSYADYFLAPPPYCDHATVRTYVHEMKETVDDMERLSLQLRRRPIHVRHSIFQLGGVTLVLEDGTRGWCGGCGHCACCNSVRHLREEIECLEDLVRRLDLATLRCPICGRLRTYDNLVLPPTCRPPIGSPGVVFGLSVGPRLFYHDHMPMHKRRQFEEHERHQEHDGRGRHEERKKEDRRKHEEHHDGPPFPGHARMHAGERWQQLAGFVLSLALD